jgi:hypothetical protein
MVEQLCMLFTLFSTSRCAIASISHDPCFKRDSRGCMSACIADVGPHWVVSMQARGVLPTSSSGDWAQDYSALYALSIADPESYWAAVVKALGITFDQPPSRQVGGRRDWDRRACTPGCLGSVLNMRWACWHIGSSTQTHNSTLLGARPRPGTWPTD